MPTSTHLDNLYINELTKAQYEAAVQNNTISDDDISLITDALDVQVDTMPVASADLLGIIVQFTGATDLTYTNGYFYKCVQTAANPATYGWVRVDVQPTPSGLPSQAGNAGKFLTTDGSDASWGTPVVATFRTWGANE